MKRRFGLRFAHGIRALAILAVVVPAAVRADAQSKAVQRFDIPAQSTGDALNTFSQQSGLRLLFPYGAVQGLRTSAVSGNFTAEDALKKMLDGTGLRYEVTADSVVLIRAAMPLTSKRVAGEANLGVTRLAQADEENSKPTAGVAASSKEESNKNSGRSADDLEEIVVTATRRKESVQKLPQAVTAITSQRLDELNAQTFEDYFRDVPGLGIITQGPGKRDYSLRGVSSGQIPTSLNIDISTVSQYFDEIPVTANGFQMDPRLVDVERVEVLRGPQGTLYGEGALGGTIRTITRKPVLDRLSGSIEGRIASTEDGAPSNNESAVLNLPLVTGKAALRLNGFYAKDGGFIDAVNLNGARQIVGLHGRDTDGGRASGYRGVLLVTPAESLSISAQAAHFENNQHFGIYQPAVGDLLVGISPCPPPPPDQPPGSSSQCYGGSSDNSSSTGDLYNLTLSGDLGWATLISSSSYAKTGVEVVQEQEFTDSPSIFAPQLSQHLEGLTQEVRLVSSKDWSSRWDYVVGAYYQDKDTKYDYFGDLIHSEELKAKEGALFGDTGYMLTKQLQVRLGLRASDVKNTGAMDIPASPFNPARHITTGADFKPVTGRATLDYFLNNDMMVYTSVARGFRNGTLNDTTVNYTPIARSSGFTLVPDHSNPDTNTSYEFGWKLSFPAHRAVVNGAVYHSDWKDMQVVSYVTNGQTGMAGIPAGVLPAYVNATRARINGAELEASVELMRGLEARVSWALIDAELAADFPLNLQSVGSELHGKKGDRIPFVARSSGSLSLNYRHAVFGDFDGFMLLNAQYQGSRATDFDKTLNSTPPDGTSPVPFTTYFRLDPYWTTDLQFGVENGQWRASVYVNNVLNDRADIFHTQAATESRMTDRPRTIGLWLRHSFK